MNIIEALTRCKSGSRVRPVVWGEINLHHWVESRRYDTTDPGTHTIFCECGSIEEIPHALRLNRDDEFLGPWEVLETP